MTLAMAGGRFEHFAHDADVGVRGIGPTREAAFEQGALALMHAIGEVEAVEPRELVEIACEAPDDALLFVDWLNALIFEVATRGMLFGRFEVRIDGTRLRAKAWGETIDPARHELGVEVKGATYTGLEVIERAAGDWLAQCVVDV
jgi:tRNA nucleotidyltransferase (CCA-adding enzyme)